MKVDVIAASVLFIEIALLPTVSCAEEAQFLSVAEHARMAASHYREVFDKKLKGSTSWTGDFSITNSANGATIVYAGVSQRLLSVAVNRAAGTNEVFRFSRQIGVITRYEACDAEWRGVGVEMSFFTNGNLQCYAQTKNAVYQGKAHWFNESGQPVKAIDVTGEPVLRISPPRGDGGTILGHGHDELIKAVRQL